MPKPGERLARWAGAKDAVIAATLDVTLQVTEHLFLLPVTDWRNNRGMGAFGRRRVLFGGPQGAAELDGVLARGQAQGKVHRARTQAARLDRA